MITWPTQQFDRHREVTNKILIQQLFFLLRYNCNPNNTFTYFQLLIQNIGEQSSQTILLALISKNRRRYFVSPCLLRLRWIFPRRLGFYFLLQYLFTGKWFSLASQIEGNIFFKSICSSFVHNMQQDKREEHFSNNFLNTIFRFDTVTMFPFKITTAQDLNLKMETGTWRSAQSL